MLRRLQKQGLVDIGSDKRIPMTARGRKAEQKGRKAGENIAHRRRLAEWLVASILGRELHEAHTEAHQLEHGMSEALEARLM